MSTGPLDSATVARSVSPWLWIPTAYFMQAVPNTLATSVFATAFMSLGIDPLQLAAWTPIISLPWTLKLLWSPLVDLTLSKRVWVLAMQAAIFALTALAAGGLLLPGPLLPVVAVLLLAALCSATHDIALDGLYLLSLARQRQAAFVGVLSTMFRLGRLFCTGVLVAGAGVLASAGLDKAVAWAVALGATALLYGAGALWNAVFLPTPPGSAAGPQTGAPPSAPPGPAPGTPPGTVPGPALGAAPGPALIAPAVAPLGPAPGTPPGAAPAGLWLSTALVLVTGVALYLYVAGVVRLVGHALAAQLQLLDPGRFADLAGRWMQTPTGYPAWLWISVVTAVLLPGLLLACRRLLRGGEVGLALGSFLLQPGIWAILFFILTYRVAEVMVGFISPLFLQDDIASGGLALSLQNIGAINGIAGVVGIILGGLVGGAFIARVGLRTAFIPLVLAMALPNLLYVWAAHLQPVGGPPLWGLYAIAFVDQFGYGFGFAGYSVYLMYVAQRTAGGAFRTTHYAIGTGLGATTILMAIAASGILQSALGYYGFFVAACLLTLPGMLALYLIPLDSSHGRGIAAREE